MKHCKRSVGAARGGRALPRAMCGLLLVLAVFPGGAAHARPGADAPLPQSVRGYKVERASVAPKKDKGGGDYGEQGGPPQLITLGNPETVEISPGSVTLSLPITVSPVEQRGEVDFLLFEDVQVNGMDAYVEEYRQPFTLPNSEPVLLPAPLRVSVATTNAVGAAGGNIIANVLGLITGGLVEPAREWRVTGRVYVCGHFRKFKLKFKRAVPVDLDFYIRNPL